MLSRLQSGFFPARRRGESCPQSDVPIKELPDWLEFVVDYFERVVDDGENLGATRKSTRKPNRRPKGQHVQHRQHGPGHPRMKQPTLPDFSSRSRIGIYRISSMRPAAFSRSQNFL